MYKLSSIILSIIISSFLNQSVTVQTVTINTTADFIEVDNQGNISSIDVTNPLRI